VGEGRSKRVVHRRGKYRNGWRAHIKIGILEVRGQYLLNVKKNGKEEQRRRKP